MDAYRYLFGTVPSRRFGRSLGIDLLPCKTCSLNCLFCQLGRTTRQTLARKEYVPAKKVIDEIDDWLKADGNADYLTLSGSGEPTVHSGFGVVLEFIRERSTIPGLLLTNGTMLHLPEVRAAACHASVVKVSLSAWDQKSFEQVNRPHPELRFEQLIKGEKALRRQFEGEVWIEVFIVWGMNSVPGDVRKIAALAEEIGPSKIQLNTAVRPPAEETAVVAPRERMEELAELFNPPAEVIAEFSADVTESLRTSGNTILDMLKRRPCTVEDIADVFGMHVNEVLKYVGTLMKTHRIRSVRKDGKIYYVSGTQVQG